MIYRDHHRRDGRGSYRLTDVYAALKTSRVRVLGDGEQIVWGIRMLADFGLMELPELDVLEPTDVTDGVLKVWRGIVLLARCRMAYDASQAQRLPLSWRFLASFCDVAENTAGRAIQEFLRRDYLRTHHSSHTKLMLFEFGPASRSRSWIAARPHLTARHAPWRRLMFDIIMPTMVGRPGRNARPVPSHAR